MKCPIMLKVSAMEEKEFNDIRKSQILGSIKGTAAGGILGTAAMALTRKHPYLRLAAIPFAGASTVAGGIYGHSRGKQVALKKLKEKKLS